jgi:hypothetical protein
MERAEQLVVHFKILAVVIILVLVEAPVVCLLLMITEDLEEPLVGLVVVEEMEVHHQLPQQVVQVVRSTQYQILRIILEAVEAVGHIMVKHLVPVVDWVAVVELDLEALATMVSHILHLMEQHTQQDQIHFQTLEVVAREEMEMVHK